jgi:hypothetical protein
MNIYCGTLPPVDATEKPNIFVILEIVDDFKMTKYISVYILIDSSID